MNRLQQIPSIGENTPARIIGIHFHHDPNLKVGDTGQTSRNTMISVWDGKRSQEYKLTEVQDQLDFCTGNYRVKLRSPTPEDDPQMTLERHQVWERAEQDEDLSAWPDNHKRDVFYKRKWRRVINEDDLSVFDEAFIDRDENNTPKRVKDWVQADLSDEAKQRQYDALDDAEKTTFVHVLRKVPVYDGVKEHDLVVMMRGGAGYQMCYTISSRMAHHGWNFGVYCVTAAALKDWRKRTDNTEDTAGDNWRLIRMFLEDHQCFRKILRPDRDIIRVNLLARERKEAQVQRIKVNNQLQAFRKMTAFNAAADIQYDPGLSIEQRARAEVSTDAALQTLEENEKRVTNELKRAVRATLVWQEIFDTQDMKGIGEITAAPLIANIDPLNFVVPISEKGRQLHREIGEIRQQVGYEEIKAHIQASDNPVVTLQRAREYVLSQDNEADADRLAHAIDLQKQYFKEKRHARQRSIAKLQAYCGVHVTTDGQGTPVFPRTRRGVRCNWNRACRQALFLISDQFNRRPGTRWGARLRQIKAAYRDKHPVPEEIQSNGKKVKRYTDGHIHSMARWKALNKFVASLYRQWLKLREEEHARALREETQDAGN